RRFLFNGFLRLRLDLDLIRVEQGQVTVLDLAGVQDASASWELRPLAEGDGGDVALVVILDAGRQPLDLHAGDVGTPRGGESLEVAVQVLEGLAHQVGPDAELPQPQVAMNALTVGGWLQVEAGEQGVLDLLGEAPAALGGAAPVLPKGVNVDIDQD